MIRRRLKRKVLFVPRKPHVDSDNKRTPEAALAALKIPPPDRTPQDIDAILAIVGTWEDFTHFIHSDQERKEVCRHMCLDFRQANTILFKQGDEPDGWYLVFSGMCSIHIKLNAHNEDGHSQIPAQTVALLRSAFGPDECFIQVAHKGPSQEFGSTALTKNDKRNATIVVDEPSQILRVDPQLYRDTAAWFARAQLEKAAALMSHIPELQFLRETRDIYTRLAENIKQEKIEIGTVVDTNYFKKVSEMTKDKYEDCFIVVGEGLLWKRRVVDFTGYRGEEMEESGLAITIPTGKRTVRVRTFQAKSMFPDPALKEYVPYPFTLVVMEPVIAYRLKVKDLASMLLTTQMQKIRDQFQDEPDDAQVVKMWIAEHQAKHWQLFKQKCVKEARGMVKVERAIMRGQWGLRLPAPPKAIKDHEPFPPLMPRTYS
jgi:CRP-like cAMP-binding protein